MDAADTNTPKLLDDYFSEQELAEQVNKSVRVIQAWREKRTGPPYTRVGKTPYYYKPAVRTWLRSLQRGAGRRPSRAKQTAPVQRDAS